MIKEVFADYELENSCSENFGLKIDVSEVIARDFPVGQSSRATMFRAQNGHIYVLISALASMNFGEVRSIVKNMMCEADEYHPPKNDPNYFDGIAKERFKTAFPGKRITSDDDLRYYRTLASYNPALVRISRISGEIRYFDRDGGSWKKLLGINYAKLKLG